VFAKLDNGRLSLTDTYPSDWIGGTGGTVYRLGGEGFLFAGIVGHLTSEGAPSSLGLLTPAVP
jgi:hypothetical protein